MNTNLNTKLETENKTSTVAGKVRWGIVFMLLLGGIVNYIDRANLSIAAPYMMKDLGLTYTDIGLLGTVFSIFYAIGQLGSGVVIDRFGSKKTYSWAVFLWGGFTVLTGAMGNMVSLIVARIGVALSESPCWPANAKIVSEWFPKKERGLATGIFDSSSKWGNVIAQPILIYLVIMTGWRGLFYITGALALVYLLFFIFYYKQPEDHKRLSKEELEYIKSGGGGTAQSSVKSKISWGSLFKHKVVWGMILGSFCIIWMFNIFLYFLPIYLLETHNVVMKEMGFWAVIPWIGGGIGSIVGGFAINAVVNKGFVPMVAKRLIIVVCSIMMCIFSSLLAFVPSGNVALAMVLAALILAFLSAVSACTWSLPSDVAPNEMVGSLAGIQNFGAYVGGSLSPLAAGIILDQTGSFLWAFLSAGIIALGSAFFYWFVVKKPIEVEA